MTFLRAVLVPALLLLSVVAGSSARNHDKQPTRRLRQSHADGDNKSYEDAKRELNRALKEARLLQNDIYKRVQVDRGERRFRSVFGKAKAKKRVLKESDNSSESEDASSDVTSSDDDTRRNRKLGEKDNALDYILQAY